MVLSQREKGLIVGIVILAMMLGFWRFVHEPLFTRRASAQELNDKVTSELTRDKAKLAREGDLKLREQAVAAREQTVDSWVPGKNSAALFIWYLSQAEQLSGAQIQSVVIGGGPTMAATADGRKDGAGTSSDATQPPTSQTAPSQSAPAQPAPSQTSPAKPAVAANLTVVTLSLKVKARFAEHLLFNQSLDEMPLFLNTEAFSMVPVDSSPLNMVGSLIAKGDIGKASALLQASPVLAGDYQLKLYFKTGKVGPSTDVMQFAEPTGRMDPFAMDRVDEFLQTLIDYYNNRPTGGTGTGSSDPTLPSLPPVIPTTPSIPPSELG